MKKIVILENCAFVNQGTYLNAQNGISLYN